GEITIASPHGLQFFKVVKDGGQEKTIQLPIGDYQVAVRDGQTVGEGNVRIEPTRLAFVTKNELKWHAADDAQNGAMKGGEGTLTLPAPDHESTMTSVLFGAHSGFIHGGAPGPFAEVGFGEHLGQFRRLELTWGGALNLHRNSVDSAHEHSSGFDSLK